MMILTSATEENVAKAKAVATEFHPFFYRGPIKHTTESLPETSNRLQNQTPAGSPQGNIEN